MSSAPHATDEQIRDRLKKAEHIAEQFCLECGYRGLMGVSHPPAWRRELLLLAIAFAVMPIVLIAVSFGIPYWVALVVTAVGLFGFEMSWERKRTVFHCPSCDKRLSPK